MDFETFREEAANYLEAAGVPYSRTLDDQLWTLYNAGAKPHEVPTKLTAN